MDTDETPATPTSPTPPVISTAVDSHLPKTAAQARPPSDGNIQTAAASALAAAAVKAKVDYKVQALCGLQLLDPNHITSISLKSCVVGQIF